MPWYGVCQASGWGLVALVNVSFALSGDANLRLGFIVLSLWGGALGLLLSHQWRRALKRRAVFDEGRPLPLPFLVGGVVALALAQVSLVAMGFYIWRQSSVQNGWGWLPPALAFWLFMYAAWTVFYGAVMAARRAKRFEIETLQLQLQVKDAELRALQAQINPHFFFNSLNSIRALMYQDVTSAANVVDRLADLMRYTLQMGRAETVTLARELEAVNSYLAIEKVRFDERMQVVLQIEPGLGLVAVPPLALQTLVENAVKYGVEKSRGPCEIRISARATSPVAGLAAGTLVLEVAQPGSLVSTVTGAATDSAQRLAAPQASAPSTQSGLANTRQRLQLLWGTAASLQLREQDGWVHATLIVPRLPHSPNLRGGVPAAGAAFALHALSELANNAASPEITGLLANRAEAHMEQAPEAIKSRATQESSCAP